MAGTKCEIISPDEAESSLQSEQQQKNLPFTTLGRQSSIYSLTLDEFQHTLCESGKNFGSMNMDEFLTSIWTAEENQGVNGSTHHPTATPDHNNNIASNAPTSHFSLTGPVIAEKGGNSIAKQPSLPRQGSLSLPAPLCQKTVDEVWSDIHRAGQQAQPQSNNNENVNGNVQNPESTARQPTFGEMTLEDFLIKAGVVREPGEVGVMSQVQPPQQQQQQYNIYPNSNSNIGASFVSRPIMGGGGASTSVGVPTYQAVPQGGGTGIGDASGFVGNGKRNGVYPPPAPPEICYGGRVVNGGGGGGYASTQSTGFPGSVSPVSPDGMCTSQVDNSGGQFGLDMDGLRGRKRVIDGPVEKVVERRQRRMIKNRESAARSRARKQAYTVELEAELNQLREENAHLKQALTELERKRKQLYFEEMKKAQTKAQKAKERLRVLRRNMSCPL